MKKKLNFLRIGTSAKPFDNFSYLDFFQIINLYCETVLTSEPSQWRAEFAAQVENEGCNNSSWDCYFSLESGTI